MIAINMTSSQVLVVKKLTMSLPCELKTVVLLCGRVWLYIYGNILLLLYGNQPGLSGQDLTF